MSSSRPLPDSLPPELEAELPFAKGTHLLRSGRAAGKKIAWMEAGTGCRDRATIVLVHGNPTWGFLWRHVVRRLEDSCHVLVPDLPGCGRSETLRLEEHSLVTHVEAVSELVRARARERIVLVGQDWGGPISVGVGRSLSTRVAGVVLANTSVLCPRRPRGTRFHRFARCPGVSELAFRGLGFPLRVLHRTQGDPRSMSPAVRRAYRWPLRTWKRRAAPLALARMVPDGPNHPSVPALRSGEAWIRAFAGPMALVWGERDPVLGHALRRHVEAFPTAVLTRTQAGHFLQEEVPDELAAAVLDVLQRGVAPRDRVAGKV